MTLEHSQLLMPTMIVIGFIMSIEILIGKSYVDKSQ